MSAINGRLRRHPKRARGAAIHLPLAAVFTLVYAFISWLLVLLTIYAAAWPGFPAASTVLLDREVFLSFSAFGLGRIVSVLCIVYLICDLQFVHPDARTHLPTLVAYLFSCLLALSCLVLWDNCGWIMAQYAAGTLR